MKATTINVQITKNPKQFEAVRIGLEASLDAGETVEGAIKAATAQLNAIYVEMYQQPQKPAQNTEKAATNANEQEGNKPAKRERLVFGDPRVQQIIKRMEKAPEKVKEIMANVEIYYELDEGAKKALMVAAKLV